jgi:hypothetical protein
MLVSDKGKGLREEQLQRLRVRMPIVLLEKTSFLAFDLNIGQLFENV